MSLLVAASNIYAKSATNEAGPGERSILFSVFGSGAEELMYEGGPVTDSFLAANPNAVTVGNWRNEISDEEDEILPLITGGSAVIQPIISSASPSAAPRTRIEIYVVKKGDTPGGIAGRFGINLSTLYWANNLSAYSVIRLGQELKIPPVDGLIYTVKKGDTINNLAKIYRTDGERILAFNQLNAQEKLVPGAVIVIPGGKPPPAPKAPAQPKNLLVPVVSAPGSLPGGRFLWPVVASLSNSGRYITQYFKWLHSGLDIDGNYSNPIIAAEGGVVKLVHYGRTGYGYQVVVDHENGMMTRYAHFSKILVEPGQRVERGQILGMMGSTGRSTGTHLHFEVFINGKRVNPLSYIR